MSLRHKFGGDILAIFGGHILFRSSGFWSNSARCRAPPWCLVQILGHHLSHLTNAESDQAHLGHAIAQYHPIIRRTSPINAYRLEIGCNTQLHFSSKMKEAQLVTSPFSNVECPHQPDRPTTDLVELLEVIGTSFGVGEGR